MRHFIITPIAIAAIVLLAFSSNSQAVGPGPNPSGPGRGHVVRHPFIGNNNHTTSVGAKALTVKAHGASTAAMAGQAAGGGNANPLLNKKEKPTQ